LKYIDFNKINEDKGFFLAQMFRNKRFFKKWLIDYLNFSARIGFSNFPKKLPSNFYLDIYGNVRVNQVVMPLERRVFFLKILFLLKNGLLQV